MARIRRVDEVAPEHLGGVAVIHVVQLSIVDEIITLGGLDELLLVVHVLHAPSVLLHFATYSSFLFHSFCFFACRIHVSSFFRAFPLDSSDSSCFRNSLFVLMLLSRSGFRPSFFGERCHSPLHPSVSFYPTRDLCLRHLFFCFFCASFDIFDPIFLFIDVFFFFFFIFLLFPCTSSFLLLC